MSGQWALGVDLGGTKLEVARVDGRGAIRESLRTATNVREGPAAVEADIVRMSRALWEGADSLPMGIGVGIAGQIDREKGQVRFAPNLGWREVPLGADLERLLGIRAVVTNDVRAITWGECVYGAGQGIADLVCLYVGTGIGGGVVTGGRLLEGCTNTAGELGHLTIDLNGPACTCGNRGCLEALAGGWAIARQAQEMVRQDQGAGEAMLAMASGSMDAITAEVAARAAAAGDPLANALFKHVSRALIAGCVSLVNAFNPCRLILGGGVMSGMPQLIDEVRSGVRRWALPAATTGLEVVPGALGASAGTVGAASLAMGTKALHT